MFNVVIIGSGEVGQYIALMLSREQHNVTLVDKDPEKLQSVSAHLDVGTKVGDGTDWELLDELLDLSPDFLLALTPFDEVNLLACSIAKNLGYPKTIARVRDNRFLNRTRLDFARVFDTDGLICPELLVANDIEKYLLSQGAMGVETFAHGAIEMRKVLIPKSWEFGGIGLKDLTLPKDVIIGLIYRKNQSLIFPHGEDTIECGDEVTCIGPKSQMRSVSKFFESPEKAIHSLVIVGGSLIALNLARCLRGSGIHIRLIEKDYARCCYFADALPECTIIHQDGTNLSFLRSEKVALADAFLAATRSDELNLLASLVGLESGVKDVVCVLSKSENQSIAEKLGIHYTVSPRLATANRLLSQVLFSGVTSCVALYDNQAEIVELQVSADSKLVGIPISELGPLLPKDFIIAVIQNRGRIMMARGNRILSPGDSVILVTAPRHIAEFSKVF